LERPAPEPSNSDTERAIYLRGVLLSEFYPIPLPDTARRRTFATAGGPLAAVEAEPAGHTPNRGIAVLVPGFSGSKEDFIPLLPRLVATGYRVVSYDQRGQYESAGPDHVRDYSVAAFAQDLRCVIDLASDSQPVHLLGHSFGALVARHLAIAEPALVRSLTLLGSGPAGDRLLRARWLSLLAWLIRLTGTKVLAVLATYMASRSGVPADRLPWLRYRVQHTGRTGLAGMCLAMAHEPDRVAELAATEVPILVMFGESDDAWSPDVQKEMARHLDARVVTIQHASHTPNEDQPQATAAALLEFWDSVDG
jgi:pimeloyl-ACP methyl ester carboxylesterase